MVVVTAGIEPATFHMWSCGKISTETFVLVKLDELDPS
jgi:hypothetical protein